MVKRADWPRCSSEKGTIGMVKLTLMFEDNTLREYPCSAGRTITIGRLNSNTVVVNDSSVSGNHSKIEEVGNGYLLTDLRSKNGTFVNDQQVISHWLRDGDRITIGKHTLVFNNEAQASQLDGPTDIDQTVIIDSRDYQDMRAKSFLNVALGSENKMAVAALAFLTGGKGEILLDKKITKIGKDPKSDIVVKGFWVGKTAAVISKRPSGYYLSFMGGIAKPKVNRQAVKDAIMLKEFDVIQIGSVTMELTYKPEAD